MARERMVTRTVMATVAEVMSLNVSTAEVQITEYTLGEVNSDKEILKRVQKMLPPEVKAVAISSKRTVETLYSMKEEDFIKYATPMAPRGTKTNTQE